jgi:hypothetical protein
MVLRAKLFNLKLFCEQEKQRVLDDLFGITRVAEFFDNNKWRVTKKNRQDFDEWRFFMLNNGRRVLNVPFFVIRIDKNGFVKNHTKEQAFTQDNKFFFYHVAVRLKYLNLRQEVKKIIPWIELGKGAKIRLVFNKKGHFQCEVRSKYGLVKFPLIYDEIEKMNIVVRATRNFLRNGKKELLIRTLKRYRALPKLAKSPS